MKTEDKERFNKLMDLQTRLKEFNLECRGLDLQIHKMVAQENGDCAGSTVEEIEDEIQKNLKENVNGREGLFYVHR